MSWIGIWASMTNDTIYITDTFTDIDAGAGDDVLILQAISSDTEAAIIRGGIGHDILDASGVFAGYSTMFFFNDEVPTDTAFDVQGFSVGPFQVEGIEEIIGNESRDNYFSLHYLEHGVTLRGGSGTIQPPASAAAQDSWLAEFYDPAPACFQSRNSFPASAPVQQ